MAQGIRWKSSRVQKLPWTILLSRVQLTVRWPGWSSKPKTKRSGTSVTDLAARQFFANRQRIGKEHEDGTGNTEQQARQLPPVGFFEPQPERTEQERTEGTEIFLLHFLCFFLFNMPSFVQRERAGPGKT